VKRIQEQDSSSTLPLVLVVSQVRWGDPNETEEQSESAELSIIGLELTDGWYRIRANIDLTLKSACERGKIVVGTKLAITGARVRPLLIF
jgi:breast cancer 2 susceptibility protein